MNTTGFPSPAQGYEEKPINFNELLLRNPASTFVMRYEGKEGSVESIFPGDFLTVDCASLPKNGNIAVIRHEGSFICVRIYTSSQRGNSNLYYTWNNKEYPCCEIFGCVKAIVRLL